MRRLRPYAVSLLGLLLVGSAPTRAADPADFPVTAVVKCSYARDTSSQTVRIGALVDGRMLELSTPLAAVPLALGTYKMRVVPQKRAKAFELSNNYDMLLPDGSTRRWYVSGVGEGICGAATSM